MQLSKQKVLYGILFVWILFNTVLERFIPGFNYFDELILAYAICCLVIYSRKRTIRIRRQLLLAIIIIVSVGLMSNYIYSLNNGVVVVIKDIIAFLKMPAAMVAFSFRNDKRNVIASNIAYSITKIVLIVMFLFWIVSFFVDLGMSADVRFGIPSYKFIYPHPTFMVYSLVLMSVVMIGHGIEKEDAIFYFINIVLLLSSFRDKAYGYIAIYLFLIVIIPNIKKIKLIHIMIVGALTYFISRDKLLLYRSYSWSPRYGLYTTGFKILKDYFPLGTGFGSFGSALSGEYYSKVYGLYDMSGRLGVSQGDYIDLGDAGYPYYYGEFGIIGFAFFVYIIVNMYRLILFLYKDNKRTAAFLLMGYLLLAMLVESTLINEAGATSMVIMFVYLGNFNNVETMK